MNGFVPGRYRLFCSYSYIDSEMKCGCQTPFSIRNENEMPQNFVPLDFKSRERVDFSYKWSLS